MTLTDVQLAKKATGDEKSKIINSESFELCLTVYDNPQKYIDLLSKLSESTFSVEISVEEA